MGSEENKVISQDKQDCLNQWSHGGLEQSSINILRLLSELEGSYQLTNYMAFDDDNAILTEMKNKYYKLYFKTVKEEKNGAKHLHPEQKVLGTTHSNAIENQ